MKGILLAGGTGSRLYPLTKTSNKHLLPVYDKNMVLYPLQTLRESGINDILIVSSPGHAGQFLELLGSGYDLGLDIKYTIQEKPLGIGHAIWVAREYAGDENVAVILGDNIIEESIEEDVQSFRGGAKLFLKRVDSPERFGIADIEDGTIRRVVEKPETPPSDLAVTGMYLFDNQVFEYASELELSDRGEVEVADLVGRYIENARLDHRIIEGYWYDAGTFEGLFRASAKMRSLKQVGREQAEGLVDDL